MANGNDERFNKWRRLDKNHPLVQELMQQREEAGLNPVVFSQFEKDREIDEILRRRPKGPQNEA